MAPLIRINHESSIEFFKLPQNNYIENTKDKSKEKKEEETWKSFIKSVTLLAGGEAQLDIFSQNSTSNSGHFPILVVAVTGFAVSFVVCVGEPEPEKGENSSSWVTLDVKHCKAGNDGFSPVDLKRTDIKNSQLVNTLISTAKKIEEQCSSDNEWEQDEDEDEDGNEVLSSIFQRLIHAGILGFCEHDESPMLPIPEPSDSSPGSSLCEDGFSLERRGVGSSKTLDNDSKALVILKDGLGIDNDRDSDFVRSYHSEYQKAETLISLNSPPLIQAVLLFPPTRFDKEEYFDKLEEDSEMIRYLIEHTFEADEYPPFPSTPSVAARSKRYKVLHDAMATVKHVESCMQVTTEPGTGAGKKSGLRILCLDGGGIRGLVSLQILEAIQNKMEDFPPLDKNGKNTLKRCFDVMAGTSTGGIIVLALALGFPIKKIQKLYFVLKDTIFTGYRPYNGKKFNKILQEWFPPSVKMKDIKDVKVIITAVYGKVNNMKLKLFTNYGDDTKEELIWKVARRTSAAPIFFNPLKEDSEDVGNDEELYRDGGLMANNPTMETLATFKGKERELENALVVSIGTGNFPEGTSRNLPNFSRRANKYVPVIATGVKLLLTAKTWGEFFVNLVTETDGKEVRHAVALCDHAGCGYIRFTPQVPGNQVELDEKDDLKLINLLYHTYAYTQRNYEHIEFVASHLQSTTNNPHVQ